MKFMIRTLIPLLLALSLTCVAVSASSADSANLVAQGDSLMKTRNYSEALSAYDQAISADRNNFNAWNGKADALNRGGKFTEALAASDTALALEPSRAPGWINRGYILYNLGRYDDELKAYETAISFEPDNAEAWFNKGYSLAGMKRYDEAIAAFDKVQALKPDYPNLAANRKIAVQLRDASTPDTPVYVRYIPVIAGILLVVAIIGGYLLYRNKTRSPSDSTEKDNRQSRRRKEKQQ